MRPKPPPPAPTLLVLHPRPSVVAPWLPSSTRDSTLLLAPLPGAAGGAEHDEIETQHYPGAEPVSFLPVDGPTASVERAAIGLRRRLPEDQRHWVVPVTEGGQPPSPGVLSLLRAHGLSPGVDLRATTWVTAEGILWTDGDAVRRLAIPAGDPNKMSRAASLTLSLRGFDVESPAGAWIAACAQGQPASPALWGPVLTAHYINVASRTRVLA